MIAFCYDLTTKFQLKLFTLLVVIGTFRACRDLGRAPLQKVHSYRGTAPPFSLTFKISRGGNRLVQLLSFGGGRQKEIKRSISWQNLPDNGYLWPCAMGIFLRGEDQRNLGYIDRVKMSDLTSDVELSACDKVSPTVWTCVLQLTRRSCERCTDKESTKDPISKLCRENIKFSFNAWSNNGVTIIKIP